MKIENALKGPVSIYHLRWAGRIRNSPYKNFVHPPPWVAFIFLWTPLKQPEFFLHPLPPQKKKKEKETETPTLALLHSTDKQWI